MWVTGSFFAVISFNVKIVKKHLQLLYRGGGIIKSYFPHSMKKET